jgi:hypothetical protein
MAYCTPDDLKELGYTWQDSDLEYITEICDTASQQVDTYCRQSFSRQTGYVDNGIVHIRCGELKYFPKNLTITNISTMAFRQVNGKIPPYLIENYEFEEDKGYIFAFTNAPNGDFRVQVKYDFGYESGSYPADLVKATMLMCAPLLDDYFMSQESNVSMVSYIKQGETAVKREDTHVSPQNAIDILNGGNGGLGYLRWRATS